MTGTIYHPERKHPAEYEQDLNPHAGQGQNRGEAPQPGKPDQPQARDIKELHNSLEGFTDDELQRIPIVSEGTRLEQGATYIDLRESPPCEFTASASMVAGADNWYVPKSKVDYPLWNRLIGVTNPARLDQAERV
jgi:hypothetical protein